MPSRVFLAAALLALLAGTASAQGSLPLQEAVSRALSQNPELAAGAARVDAARAGEDLARAGYLPRVDIVESWQRGNAPLFAFSSLLSAREVTPADFAPDRLNHPDATAFFRAGVSVQQTLFDGFRTLRAMDMARYGRESASAGLDARRHSLALEVVRAYADGLLADTRVAAARSAVEAASADAARTRERRDAGMATDADMLSLDVHLADMNARLIQAEAERDLAQARLNRLMGAPLDTVHQLQEPAVPPPAAADIKALEERALTARPDFLQANLQVAMAEAARKAATGAYMPSVGVQAAYDWSGRDFSTRPGAWVVGAEIRWNLFAGGSDRARLAGARAEAAAAEASRRAAEAGVRESVRTSARLLEAARARDAVGRAAATQAREAERVIRERFEAGLATVTDLLRASTATLDADLRASAARLDVVMTSALLQQSVGQLPAQP